MKNLWKVELSRTEIWRISTMCGMVQKKNVWNFEKSSLRNFRKNKFCNRSAVFLTIWHHHRTCGVIQWGFLFLVFYWVLADSSEHSNQKSRRKEGLQARAVMKCSSTNWPSERLNHSRFSKLCSFVKNLRTKNVHYITKCNKILQPLFISNSFLSNSIF